MSSVAERIIQSLIGRLVKKALDAILDKSSEDSSLEKGPMESKKKYEKNHPWRLCPMGKHWVITHPLTVPTNANGVERMTTRHGHCRTNPGKSEFYTAAELRDMRIYIFETFQASRLSCLFPMHWVFQTATSMIS